MSSSLTWTDDYSTTHSNCVYLSQIDIKSLNIDIGQHVIINNKQVLPVNIGENLTVGDAAASSLLLQSLNIDNSTSDHDIILKVEPWTANRTLDANSVELRLYFTNS